MSSVLAGILYLRLAGAPDRYLLIQLSALVTAVVFALFVGWLQIRKLGWLEALLCGGGAAVFLTALLGIQQMGIKRWIHAGSLTLQPSLIVVPALLVAAASGARGLVRLGVVLASVGLALQPDRAVMLVLFAGLAIVHLQQRDRYWLGPLALSGAGCVVTFLRQDPLSAVPYVERIYASIPSLPVLAAAAVVLGTILMLLPGYRGVMSGGATARVCAVFAVVWFGMLLSSAIGNYPTPLIGYGASSVIGYCFSAALLPGRTVS